MNKDLEVIKASAEGVAAGATQALQTVITNLLGGWSEEVGDELRESAKRWRERRALALGKSVLGRLEGRPRRPIPRNVLLPAFDYATLEDREELLSLWAELLATAGTEGSAEVDRLYAEILKDLTPRDARVLQLARSRPPELDGHDPRSMDGNKFIPPTPDMIRPRVTRETAMQELRLSDSDFELTASRLARSGLCEPGRYIFPTTLGYGSTGPRIYDAIALTPLGIAFVDAVTPEQANKNL